MKSIFNLAECVLLLRAVKLCFENHILLRPVVMFSTFMKTHFWLFANMYLYGVVARGCKVGDCAP